MTDYNVTETERWINAEEDASVAACLRAAEAHGLTVEDAYHCDGGNMNCPTCPWKKEPLP